LKAYLAALDYSLLDVNKKREGFFYWNTFSMASLLNGITSDEANAKSESANPTALNIYFSFVVIIIKNIHDL